MNRYKIPLLIAVIASIILLFFITRPTNYYHVTYSEYYHEWIITDNEPTELLPDYKIFINNVPIYTATPNVANAKYYTKGSIYYDGKYKVKSRKILKIQRYESARFSQ